MAKLIPEHKDRLGREITVGDCVAYPSNNSLYIGTVTKLHTKMIGVTAIGSKYKSSSNKYPQEIVKLEGPDVTMYLLMNQK
jgi:hypothetical protein